MGNLESAIEAEVASRVAAELAKVSAVPAVFTVPEAAEKMKVSRSTVYEMLKAGEIQRSPVKRRVLIPASEVARVLGGAA